MFINCLAVFFEEKLEKIVKNANIDPNVYNGRTKMTVAESNFMSPLEIVECVKQLKIKNCESYDHIPQRILIDGIIILIKPLSQLFNFIYRDKQIPEQWLIAKITPIHKKRITKQS